MFILQWHRGWGCSLIHITAVRFKTASHAIRSSIIIWRVSDSDDASQGSIHSNDKKHKALSLQLFLFWFPHFLHLILLKWFGYQFKRLFSFIHLIRHFAMRKERKITQYEIFITRNFEILITNWAGLFSVYCICASSTLDTSWQTSPFL